MTIYLDHAATAPVRREVLAAMWPFLAGEPGNPGSHHSPGVRAAGALRAALADIAAVLGCRPGEVVLTSGGTEAANLAVKGIALARPRGRHLITTAVEHPAVLESCRALARAGFDLTVLPVDRFGLVDPQQVEESLRADTALVSVQLANNEVGSIQPVQRIAALTRERGVPMHTDAVQAAGALPIGLDVLGVDAVSIAGHKVGTPVGIGALAVRAGVPIEPLVHGGGQQRGRRSGTENVAAAIGLAAALVLAEGERQGASALAARRDAFVADVLAAVGGAALTGHPRRRLPGSASFVVAGISGESLLTELDARGIAISSGSACAAGDDEPSPVLVAMEFDDATAQSAIRITMSASTTDEELDAAVHVLREAAAGVRALA